MLYIATIYDIDNSYSHKVYDCDYDIQAIINASLNNGDKQIWFFDTYVPVDDFKRRYRLDTLEQWALDRAGKTIYKARPKGAL